MVKVSIVIPNWNGRKLLEKNLPSVLATKPAEVIVVDDASPDNSNEFLEKNYPQIKIVKHKKNLGFAVSCNDGVEAAQSEVIALLNLDVVPEKDLLEFVLPHFQDPKVFAVSFHEPAWSWAKISWRKGFIEHEPGPKTKKAHISAWASGGSAAFRKDIWESLGGFDEIYYPFYWEDVDLGYRAWKRGYKIMWEPKAIVHHKHEAIIGKHFSKEYIDFISERNRLLFIWKNITDFKMIMKHKLWCLWKLRSLGFWKPFLAAKVKLPLILLRKIKGWQDTKVSDSEIFKIFAKFT
ncbi:MAG: glycosyltransferase family 2 protein [Patescibacteria group bacterium]